MALFCTFWELVENHVGWFTNWSSMMHLDKIFVVAVKRPLDPRPRLRRRRGSFWEFLGVFGRRRLYRSRSRCQLVLTHQTSNTPVLPLVLSFLILYLYLSVNFMTNTKENDEKFSSWSNWHLFSWFVFVSELHDKYQRSQWGFLNTIYLNMLVLFRCNPCW